MNVKNMTGVERLSLVRSPDVTFEQLTELSQDPDPHVSFPAKQKIEIELRAREAAEKKAMALRREKELRAKEKELKAKERLRVKKLKKQQEEVWSMTYDEKINIARSSVPLPREIIRIMAQDKDPKICKILAAEPYSDHVVYSLLAEHKDSGVVCVLVENISCPDRVCKRLAKTRKDANVLQAIANRYLTYNMSKRSMSKRSLRVLSALANNLNCSLPLLTKLANYVPASPRIVDTLIKFIKLLGLERAAYKGLRQELRMQKKKH